MACIMRYGYRKSKRTTKREQPSRMELTRLNQELEEKLRQRTAELEGTSLRLQEAMLETYEALDEVAIWEERNRIAHDIHDMLGHQLAGAAVQLEAAKRLTHIDPDSARSKLDAALESVRRGLEDVRIAVRMMKEHSPKKDWADALHELMDEMERMTGVTINRLIHGDIPVLDAFTKKSIHHALQAGLANGMKRGASRRFDFSLRMEGNMLRFSLKHDGTSHTTMPDGDSTFLHAMNEKIRHLGGSVELLPTSPLGGAELRIALPLKNE